MKYALVLGIAALVAAPFAASAATTPGLLPVGWSFVGNAGSGTLDGDVFAPPVPGGYTYVSTSGGLDGVGQIAGSGGTNGSSMTSNTFAAAQGDVLQFFFYFVTSDGPFVTPDGAVFADYAWAELNNLTADTDFLLFSVRTTLSVNAVTGFRLADLGVGVGVTVGETRIFSRVPRWSALGGSTDRCFAIGCGLTGWVSASYTIETAGNYSLGFGVTNSWDELAQTGLAVAGANIGGTPISPIPPIPLPAAGWLLVAALGGLGVLRRRRQS